MNKFNDRLYYALLEAFDEADKMISADGALSGDFKRIQFFSTQVLANCFPSDFDNLRKGGLFPIVEAELELEYSLFFAKAGIYKVAYMCLRSFMELSLVCFQCLLTGKSAMEWVVGREPTPFKKQILRTLFENEHFCQLDHYLQIRDRIDTYYNRLSDVCHTRGQPCSHLTLSKGNYPRTVEESLHSYLAVSKDVIDVVITCFVAVNPIILFPLPIDEKFGINGPLSGFLEEYKTDALRGLLNPVSLKALLRYFESDPGVNSLREYFEHLPDITDKEFGKQLDDFDAFVKEAEERNAQRIENGT